MDDMILPLEILISFLVAALCLGIYQSLRNFPQEKIVLPRYPEEKKITKFCDIREQLIEALEKSLPMCGLEEEKGFSLLDGFISPIIYSKLELEDIILSGPIIPMVMIIGNKSGQIYYFALKKLLPDIEL